MESQRLHAKKNEHFRGLKAFLIKFVRAPYIFVSQNTSLKEYKYYKPWFSCTMVF